MDLSQRFGRNFFGLVPKTLGMTRLAPLALTFASGALLSSHIGTPTPLIAVMWGAALVFVLAACRPGRAMILAVAALAGAGRMALDELDARREPIMYPLHPGPGAVADDRTDDILTGVVYGPVEDQAHGRSFLLEVDAPAEARVAVTVRPQPDRAPHDAPDETIDDNGTGWTDDAPEDLPQSAPGLLPGDRITVWGKLRAPRGYRVPGAVDVERLARARGADFLLYATRVELVQAGASLSSWRHATWLQRRASAGILARGGDRAGNAIVRAMVTGDRQGLDQAVSQRFRDSGAAHVLSVSGLHLAVVAMLVFGLVRRLWAAFPGLAMRMRPALVAALVAAPAAIGYTMMTGAQIATLRALLVVLVVLVGAATDRRARMIDALGLAALVLLVHRPAVLFDPGFQLSFSATVTLALVFEHVPRARRPGMARRLFGWLMNLLRASLWAALATAPFTALTFGQVATGGLVANMIVVPLTELCILPLGMAGCVLSVLWPWAGGVLLDAVIAVAAGTDHVVGVVAGLAPVFTVYPPDAWELGGAAMVWAGAMAAARAACSRRLACLVMVLGMVVAVASYAVTTRLLPMWRQDVRITFLDVGQGDAAIIELPGGAVWMIDGGGLPFVAEHGLADQERDQRAEAPGLHAVARFLAWRRIGRIDRLVISHPHPDHYEGVRAVARLVDVDEVWVARDYEHTPPAYRELLVALRAAGARIVHPRLDETYRDHGIAFTVLGPRYLDGVATADPVSHANDNSLVLRMEAFGRRVLFAGDVEYEAEELLVAGHAGALAADVVKVPHHGSRTSSTARFVAATSPAWAVISCGVGNRFGLPAAEVVERWQRAGARVLRTDRVGAVTAIISRHGELEVQVFDPLP